MSELHRHMIGFKDLAETFSVVLHFRTQLRKSKWGRCSEGETPAWDHRCRVSILHFTAVLQSDMAAFLLTVPVSLSSKQWQCAHTHSLTSGIISSWLLLKLSQFSNILFMFQALHVPVRCISLLFYLVENKKMVFARSNCSLNQGANPTWCKSSCCKAYEDQDLPSH